MDGSTAHAPAQSQSLRNQGSRSDQAPSWPSWSRFGSQSLRNQGSRSDVVQFRNGEVSRVSIPSKSGKPVRLDEKCPWPEGAESQSLRNQGSRSDTGRIRKHGRISSQSLRNQGSRSDTRVFGSDAKRARLNPFEIREAGQTALRVAHAEWEKSQSLRNQGSRSDMGEEICPALDQSQSLRNQGSRSDSALEIVQC